MKIIKVQHKIKLQTHGAYVAFFETSQICAFFPFSDQSKMVD